LLLLLFQSIGQCKHDQPAGTRRASHPRLSYHSNKPSHNRPAWLDFKKTRGLYKSHT
jgi:hypothetical protein